MESMLRVPLMLACCLAIVSCAAKTNRNAPVTLLDFRTQNVERLHSGIERLVGDDSAGVAAMEYLGSYIDDLRKYYPVYRDAIAPVEPNPHSYFSWYWPRNVASKFSETNPINPDLQTRRLLDYLKNRRMGAIADLRNNHDEYIRRGTVANAKMGLVNAYVAVTAMPSPNDIQLIADLVEPLLTELIRK